jgi:5-methylthioadenosine/S-adenosylhomocysteine deaminase
MEAVDTLISARWMIPIEPAACVLERHSVAVHGGRIVAILPTAEAVLRYSARETVERTSHVLLPGFVNAHAAVSTTLLRRSTVVGSSSADPETVHDGAELAMARMIASGTTCFAETGVYPHIVSRTAVNLHLRACVGLPVHERPTAWGTTIDDYFEKGSALHDEYSADPLISTAFATGQTSLLSDETLQRLQRAADEIELPVMMPLHDGTRDLSQTIEKYGCRPLVRLEKLGLATPQLVGLHLTELDDVDIEILFRTGVHAIACPRANLYLRRGACPVAELNERHVNVGLGTGNAPASDVQGEMRLAGLLGYRNPEVHASLTAHDALRIATLGGARALGLAESIGSLSPGKWADLCCVDLSALHTQPVFDVPTQLVNSALQDQVTDVWVAGRALLAAQNLVRMDISATVERAARWIS